MKTSLSALLAIVILVAAPLPLIAAEDHFGHFGRGEGMRPGWQGRDIRHFGGRDIGVWRGGQWRHGWHGDRLGWWWVVGGLWFFYPQPIYPYPDPYTPPIEVESAPPVVIQQAPPSSQPPQYWYYCESAKGYYPYVPSCSEGWKKVPATPPGALQ